ncbi:MAG: ABC transporter ATP-binding protein [Acidimicrobiales bacterium]
MTDACARASGLSKRFGGVDAVRGVDLEVSPGERRVVLGPNGAGKTTLFNLICGIERPTSGTVELFGRDVTLMPVRRRAHLGMARTFQTSRVLRGLSVDDNLYLGALGAQGGHLRIARARRDREVRERGRRAGGRVGLEDRLKTLAGELSYGEQRQLELGVTLAGEPRLLLLDEPAAGLSSVERQRLTQLLLSLDRAITLVMVEHDMDVALTVAERVTVMHRGAVVVEGPPAEIREDKLVRDIYLGRSYAI